MRIARPARDMGTTAPMTGQVVGLVPARSGSRGLKNKNVRELDGVPLLVRAVQSGLAASSLDYVFVSTDSPDYADLARRAGADVSFLRPAEFAGDAATDLDVARHVVSMLDAAGRPPAIIAWLRPTTPLRQPADIDNAVALLRSRPDLHSVRSITKVTKGHPYWSKRRDQDTGMLTPYVDGCDERTHPRRQVLPPVFRANGVIDVFHADNPRQDFLFGTRMLGYEVPEMRSVDIDAAVDLVMAEACLRWLHENGSGEAAAIPTAAYEMAVV